MASKKKIFKQESKDDVKQKLNVSEKTGDIELLQSTDNGNSFLKSTMDINKDILKRQVVLSLLCSKNGYVSDIDHFVNHIFEIADAVMKKFDE